MNERNCHYQAIWKGIIHRKLRTPQLSCIHHWHLSFHSISFTRSISTTSAYRVPIEANHLPINIIPLPSNALTRMMQDEQTCAYMQQSKQVQYHLLYSLQTSKFISGSGFFDQGIRGHKIEHYTTLFLFQVSLCSQLVII